MRPKEERFQEFYTCKNILSNEYSEVFDHKFDWIDQSYPYKIRRHCITRLEIYVLFRKSIHHPYK